MEPTADICIRIGFILLHAGGSERSWKKFEEALRINEANTFKDVRLWRGIWGNLDLSATRLGKMQCFTELEYVFLNCLLLS